MLPPVSNKMLPANYILPRVTRYTSFAARSSHNPPPSTTSYPILVLSAYVSGGNCPSICTSTRSVFYEVRTIGE